MNNKIIITCFIILKNTIIQKCIKVEFYFDHKFDELIYTKIKYEI